MRVLLGLLLRTVSIASALTVAATACADDGVSIADARNITWQIAGDRVYVRNLSSFDSTFLPCCYNYYIDISSETGRAMFAAFLTSYSGGWRLTVYVSNKAISGPVTLLGPT